MNWLLLAISGFFFVFGVVFLVDEKVTGEHAFRFIYASAMFAIAAGLA